MLHFRALFRSSIRQSVDCTTNIHISSEWKITYREKVVQSDHIITKFLFKYKRLIDYLPFICGKYIHIEIARRFNGARARSQREILPTTACIFFNYPFTYQRDSYRTRCNYRQVIRHDNYRTRPSTYKLSTNYVKVIVKRGTTCVDLGKPLKMMKILRSLSFVRSSWWVAKIILVKWLN